ncbi:MAG: iron export ABC transporter permease subunit FetB [Nitrospinota bacterium]|nr:iron export ABC transporter permease subunit FetB [Nitrospinota bacterium]
MNIESLVLAYGLVIAAFLISYFNDLKLEWDLVYSSARGTVQLILMGFILQAVLEIDRMDYLLSILVFMCGVAGFVSGKRGEKIPHAAWVAFAGIAVGSFSTFFLLYFAGVIQQDAQYVIPLGGMIIGNAMRASSLTLNRLTGELENQRPRVENLLALGANARQASTIPVRQAVRAAMIPTIDTLKTVGLVHLPGMMTGFMVAGGSPVLAVKYQLVIMYMISGATAITCLIVTLLAYRQCFTPHLQLTPSFRPEQ